MTNTTKNKRKIRANLADESKKNLKPRPTCTKNTNKNNKNTNKPNKNQKKSNKNTKNSPASTETPTTRADFLLLQKSWYARLKEDGFKDIEIFNFSRGNPNAGEPTDYMHGHSLKQFSDMDQWQASYHYYSRLQNFLTHNPRWAGPRAVHSLVARLYTKGLPYSRIVREVKRAGLKDNMNKWHVHHIVKEFEAKAAAWNKKSHLGLDYDSDF